MKFTHFKNSFFLSGYTVFAVKNLVTPALRPINNDDESKSELYGQNELNFLNGLSESIKGSNLYLIRQGWALASRIHEVIEVETFFEGVFADIYDGISQDFVFKKFRETKSAFNDVDVCIWTYNMILLRGHSWLHLKISRFKIDRTRIGEMPEVPPPFLSKFWRQKFCENGGQFRW